MSLVLMAVFADGKYDSAERAEVTRVAESLSQGSDSNVAAVYQDVLLKHASLAGALGGAEPALLTGAMPADEQDRVILNYAILNGALELLPDSLASMAIIPLQMKMVYRIGKPYGFDLDRGHIKDFLATAGVGMASQHVEQSGVILLGRVFARSLLDGLLGGVANQAVSSGFSFATTFALGRLAIRYSAGGRTFSTQVLRDTYASLMGEAKGLQGQYLPAIQEKARTVDVAQILQDVRQQAAGTGRNAAIQPAINLAMSSRAACSDAEIFEVRPRNPPAASATCRARSRPIALISSRSVAVREGQRLCT